MVHKSTQKDVFQPKIPMKGVFCVKNIQHGGMCGQHKGAEFYLLCSALLCSALLCSALLSVYGGKYIAVNPLATKNRKKYHWIYYTIRPENCKT